jgi:hypothetical protein
MRILSLAVVAALATPAFAEDVAVIGTYDVKYEEMSNNCTNVGMTLARGQLKIEVKSNTLVIDIERVPLMSGIPTKNGAVNAKSKLGPTSIQGLDGTFSIGGRVSGNDGMLQLVFVAEYQAKGKALCTQSWNVTGVRAKK